MTKKISANGFSLVEILVALTIVGIVLATSLFGIQGSRLSSRDAKRKSDLETIRSGLELYRTDCGQYPAASGGVVANPLVGTGIGSCAASNTYIASTPLDPLAPGTVRIYAYVPTLVSGSYTSYVLCSALENIGSSPPGVPTGCPLGANGCGTGAQCTYKVTSP